MHDTHGGGEFDSLNTECNYNPTIIKTQIPDSMRGAVSAGRHSHKRARNSQYEILLGCPVFNPKPFKRGTKGLRVFAQSRLSELLALLQWLVI